MTNRLAAATIGLVVILTTIALAISLAVPSSAQGGTAIYLPILQSNAGPSISGSVRDNESFVPLAGAQVTANGPTGNFSSSTSPDGTYEIANIAPGAYTVTASLPGYAPSVASTVVGSGMATLDLFLSAFTPTPTATPSASATSTASPTSTATPVPGNISGVVRDSSNGAFVINATVVAVGPSGTVGTISGLDGSFSLFGLWPGDYQVSVSAEGYRSETLPETVASSVTTTANFTLSMLTPTPTPLTSTPTPSSTVTETASQTPTVTATSTPRATPTICEVPLTWQTKAPMPTARRGIGLVATSDGKLYAIGGYDLATGQTVEMYDPASDTWVTLAPMPTSRGGVGAALGSNGKIYVAGGELPGIGPIATMEEYDPSTNTWTTRKSMPTARGGLGLAATLNGKLYAIGGAGSAAVEEYDLASDTWIARQSMPTARQWLGVATAPNSRIYAVGGGNGPLLNTVEEYDPLANTWATRSPMPTTRWALGVAVSPSGLLYAVGGNGGGGVPGGNLSTVEIYNTATDTWTTGNSMLTKRQGVAAAIAANNTLFAMGGEIDANVDTSANESAPLCATVTPTPTHSSDLVWKTVAPMLTSRTQLGAAEGPNGLIYAVGGNSASEVFAAVEQYNPKTDTWTTKASLPVGRYQLGVVTGLDGKVYALGGAISATDSSQWTTEVDQYDPTTNTWTRKHDLAVPYASTAAGLGGDGNIYAFGDNGLCVTYSPGLDQSSTCTVVPVPVNARAAASAPNGSVYVIGGNLGCAPQSANQQFNPATNSYSQAATMPTARSYLSAGTGSNGKIYAVGGVTGNCTNVTAEVEEFDPVSNSWVGRASMPTARGSPGVVGSSDGLLYVIGGNNANGGGEMATVEVAVLP